MSFRRYLRSAVPEGLLCAAAAAAASLCFVEGFYVPDALLGRVGPVLLPCILTALFFLLASYTRTTALAGGVLFSAGFAAAVFALVRGGQESDGRGLFLLLCVGVTAAIFLLSRTRLGGAAAVVLGTLIISGDAFLQYGSHPVALAVFLICAACLFLVRNYHSSMLRNSTRRASAGRYAAAGFLCCLLAAGCSAGICLAVIQPLQMPTMELKLVTQLNRLPLLEKLGVATPYALLDPDRTSDSPNDSTIASDRTGSEETPVQPNEKSSQASVQQEAQPDETPSAAAQTPADAISYSPKNYAPIFLAVGILAFAAAVFGGKLLLRQLRLRRLQKLPRQKQILCFYSYFLRMLALAKLPSARADTPREYCEKLRGRGDRFFSERGLFPALTETFDRVCYGCEEPGEDEYLRFLNAYRAFPSLCRRDLGLIRYLPVFFRT